MNKYFYEDVKLLQKVSINVCKDVSTDECRGGKCPFDDKKHGCVIYALRNAIRDVLENQ